MNKSELIEALAPRLGGRQQAAAAVEAVVDVVLRQVAEGSTVGITGFGTFEKVERAPRTGRNPRTGEAVPIAGTSSPRFRPGAYFKDVVSDPSALPADGLAGARVGTDGTVERAGAPASVRRGSETTSRPARRKSTAKSTTKSTTPRRTATSGTPASVRKESRSDAAGTGAASSGAPAGSTSQQTPTSPTAQKAQKTQKAQKPPTTGQAASATGGRVMSGGEDITAGMITAKKAQLAQVKNDELASRDKKSKKKAKDAAKKSDKGGKKGKDGSKKKGKGKKGKKG